MNNLNLLNRLARLKPEVLNNGWEKAGSSIIGGCCWRVGLMSWGFFREVDDYAIVVNSHGSLPLMLPYKIRIEPSWDT